MANSYFKFKSFTIEQKNCAMKVTTDACLFGAWVASHLPDCKQVLDIGGGTGLLSLMMAQKNNAVITSIEIEVDCFHQLQENIQQSIFSDRIKLVHGNILEYDTNLKFDAIVTNPPFHEQQLKSDSRGINQARHDDSLLLTDLFKKAAELINEDGSFFVLLPFYRNDECMNFANEFGFHPKQITEVHQSLNHKAFRMMYWFERKHRNLNEDQLFITNSDGSYTAAFTAMLKDYYLYL
jgi:tRNA1Val (adenine37-N6)-methyltransferase